MYVCVCHVFIGGLGGLDMCSTWVDKHKNITASFLAVRLKMVCLYFSVCVCFQMVTFVKVWQSRAMLTMDCIVNDTDNNIQLAQMILALLCILLFSFLNTSFKTKTLFYHCLYYIDTSAGLWHS